MIKLLTPEQTLKLNLKGMKLIEASAGTGKTYTICNLFCRYIMDGYGIQNILLVTFTNAATDELKQRIRLRIKDVLSVLNEKTVSKDEFLTLLAVSFKAQEISQQELIMNRFTLAMRSFDEAAIHTINGFCQRMLSDYAFNSAQHYELNLITNDNELWMNALKDWWRINSYELNSQYFALFNQAVLSLTKITEDSQALRSDSQQLLIPPEHPSLAQLYAEWDDLLLQVSHFKALWQGSKQAIIEFFNEHQIFKKNTLHGDNNIKANLAVLNDFLAEPNAEFLIKEFALICSSQLLKNTYKQQLALLEGLDDALLLQADELWQRQQRIVEQLSASALIDAQNFAQEQTLQAKLKQQSITFNDQLQRLNSALASSNGALANTISSQFPIALIDEFQDTNDVQYSIFKHIYQSTKETSLMMIGDPKQAIYSFRGGDIFTYIKAKKSVGDQLYSLNSNWRSTPELIDAVNTLFKQRDDAFIYTQAMPFEAVVSGSDNTPVLTRNKQAETALSVWHLAQGHSSPSAATNINHHVANEISALINEGQKGVAKLGDKPVKPADIAILVRSNYEGKELAIALKKRGIHAITIGKDKVLQSDAAKGLLPLLLGVAQADNLQAIRNMLASRLLMLSPMTIKARLNDQNTWLEWVSHVKTLHELWLKEGFICMFNSLLRLLNLVPAVLKQDDSERQLTNLLHSVEIIQHASKTHATPQALCAWLKQQINQPALSTSDEDELRLESEAQLVKIVTVHKSKGLEYPIVFIPFLWKSKPVSKSKTYYQYHNEQQQKVFDFLMTDSSAKQAFINADKERLAEDMRLLYVALTRAKSKCYLITGQASRTGSRYSALSFLCHAAQSADDLALKRSDIESYAKKHDVAQELQQLADSSNHHIDFKVLDEEPSIISCAVTKNDETTIQVAEFTGNLNIDWHISSFSRMTRDVHQVAHGGQMLSTSDDIFNFKRGGDAGTFLHHILELLDFSGDIALQSKQLFKRFAARYYLDNDDNEQTVVRWMHEIVNTTLNDQGLSLAMIKPAQRMDELAFDFSLQNVDINALNHYLAQRTGQTGSMLSISNFKGMMTGFIDLVFEHDGKFYICDYKSNFLGTQLSDYTADKLHQAVIDRRYDLQYLLYSLALHRYLRYRLPNYDYQRHFGGVYYLFLRAMRQKSNHQFGVYYDCPTLKEMDMLDNQLFKSLENS